MVRSQNNHIEHTTRGMGWKWAGIPWEIITANPIACRCQRHGLNDPQTHCGPHALYDDVLHLGSGNDEEAPIMAFRQSTGWQGLFGIETKPPLLWMVGRELDRRRYERAGGFMPICAAALRGTSPSRERSL